MTKTSNAMRPLSVEGREELLQKLNELHRYKDELIEGIGNARDSETDILENSEYLVAQEEMNKVMEKITKLDSIIANSYVVDPSNIQIDKVTLYNKVTVFNSKLKKEQVYMLVSDAETNPKQGKISTSSPLGSSLFNKKIGDIVEFDAPAGKISLNILDISI